MATFLRTFTLDSVWFSSRVTLFVSHDDKYADITYVRDGLIKRSQIIDFDRVSTVEAATLFLNGDPASFDDDKSLVIRLHKDWRDDEGSVFLPQQAA